MDAARKLSQKGFALVWVVLMIVVLVGLVSLAVDLGYMYVAKGQLQNAADAAALAGAARLDGSADEVANAKAEAKKFAQANKAAGDAVIITDQDILVGNYNASIADTPFRVGMTPYNAVQVTARRDVGGETAEHQGKIHTFFGGIFALLPSGGAGWSEMAAGAAATARRPPRPAAGLLLCDSWCAPTPVAEGTSATFYWNGKDAKDHYPLESYGKYILAFSDYDELAPVPFAKNASVMQYINGTLDAPFASSLCSLLIYSNNAAAQPALTALKERVAKESLLTPNYWEIIVPLVTSTNASYTCLSPDQQGMAAKKEDERYRVTRFAKVRVSNVEGHPDPSMNIEFRECIECSDIDNVMAAFKPHLVRNNKTVGN